MKTGHSQWFTQKLLYLLATFIFRAVISNSSFGQLRRVFLLQRGMKLPLNTNNGEGFCLLYIAGTAYLIFLHFSCKTSFNITGFFDTVKAQVQRA